MFRQFLALPKCPWTFSGLVQDTFDVNPLVAGLSGFLDAVFVVTKCPWTFSVRYFRT